MKNKLAYLLTIAVIALVFASCKKDEHKIYYEDGTAPVLTASTTGPLVLTKATATRAALKLNWTNPNYRFTTGTSSQDVTYILQVDSAGKNFSSSKLQEVSFSKDLETTFTDTLLNSILAVLELSEDKPHDIDMRIKSSLAGGTVPLYSNVIKLTVTPYLDVAVQLPASGNLYITGSATPGDWMKDNAPELVSQRFTQVNKTLYEITVKLTANNSFVFVPVYGNWSDKYAYTGAKNGNNVDGDSFQRGGEDLKAPAQTANYKVTVNFKTGRYSVTKQ